MAESSNATTSWNYTLATSPQGFGVKQEKGDRPEPAPQGLINTRAVQTKDGFRGQVIVDREIVWEGEPIDGDGEAAMVEAQQEANAVVVRAVKALFTSPPSALLEVAVPEQQAPGGVIPPS